MIEKATFGAGCFWGVQEEFDKLNGVFGSTVGYAGGEFNNPTYKDVCTGKTGHAEVIQIEYDPEIITYKELLKTFLSIHNPTTPNRQGLDVGSQYRSIILTHNNQQQEEAQKLKKEMQTNGSFVSEIVTEIVPIIEFHKAEEYHQKYYLKNKWI